MANFAICKSSKSWNPHIFLKHLLKWVIWKTLIAQTGFFPSIKNTPLFFQLENRMKWCKSTAAHSSALMHHMASFNNHSEKQGDYKRVPESHPFFRNPKKPKKTARARCFIALALKTAHLIPNLKSQNWYLLCPFPFLSQSTHRSGFIKSTGRKNGKFRLSNVKKVYFLFMKMWRNQPQKSNTKEKF